MNRNRLMKSNTDYIFLGVCGGIAEGLLIPSFIVRIVFVFLPVSIVLYLILGALMGRDELLYGSFHYKKNNMLKVLLALVLSVFVVLFLNSL